MAERILTGRAAAPGLAAGTVRVLDQAGTDSDPPSPGSILAARDMSPDCFLATDWSQGGAVLLTAGSPSSHLAVLARARGIPVIIGLGGDPGALVGDALVDGERGEVVLSPGAERRQAFAVLQAEADHVRVAAAPLMGRPARTGDGTPVAVQLSVTDPADLAAVSPDQCDGIGLVRTEFLFRRGVLPGEAAQFGVYRTLVEWAGGKPVTLRTLDAGGDKPIPGVAAPGESNPFMGLRGVRLSLRQPDLFRIQLRALLRAAAYGSLRVMLPMVTVPAELEAVRLLMDAEEADLRAAGTRCARPPLGIMVEVPAAALAVDLFDAAFVSIGMNDLTHYVTAAGRDAGEVAALADPSHPGVLRLIATVVESSRGAGREVSLCGDAAGDPAHIPALLKAGIRSLTVAPTALARTKLALAQAVLP